MTITIVIPSTNEKNDEYRMRRKAHIERLSKRTKYIVLCNSEILKGYIL